MNEKMKKQILAICDTGETNMFAVNTVQRMAFNNGFYELVCFIEDNKEDYVKFILYGRV